MRVPIMLLILVCCGTGTVLAADSPTETGIPAVWKQQKLNFHYFGLTSRYSCLGMRDKMRVLMHEVGVHKDLRLLPYGCEVDDRIDLKGISPGLNIEFRAPVPQDQGDKGERLFDARYVPFDFHRDAFRNLNIGDCELVEEFARQVLPLLTVRNLKQDISCVPYQQSGSSYHVTGEVLKAVAAAPADQRK